MCNIVNNFEPESDIYLIIALNNDFHVLFVIGDRLSFAEFSIFIASR